MEEKRKGKLVIFDWVARGKGIERFQPCGEHNQGERSSNKEREERARKMGWLDRL